MPKSDYRSAQDLLHRIGYPIAVDGNWGPRSKAALSSFQRAFNPGGAFAAGQGPLSVDGAPGPKSFAAMQVSADNRGQLSENFHYYEFACGSGHDPYCGGWLECPRALLVTAEGIRQKLCVPRGHGLEIVGPSRCDARNTKIIGGASNSDHLHRKGGIAFDLQPFWTWQQIRDAHVGVTAMEIRKGHGDQCYHVSVRPGSTTAPEIFYW
jgi:hypothetical protein